MSVGTRNNLNKKGYKMDYDFHYYATKAASLLAGFKEEEAEIIAESALFVDYCDWSNFGYDIGKKGDEEYTVQTSQFNAKLDSFQRGKNGDPSIWATFHFVPGNYPHENQHKKFKVIPTDSNNSYALCRPYSQLAISMIKDTKETINKYKLKDRAKLALIGIRMHVLADTWAHQNFTGIPDSSSNAISGYLQKENNSSTKWEDINWTITGGDKDMAPNFISNIGHGAAGHLPDMGWLKFRYLPKTNQGKYVERDNPKEFKDAFIGLACELSYIRTGKHIKEECIKIIENKSFLSSDSSAPHQIEIPKTILDMIIKDIPFNENTTVFKESAKQWEDYFFKCNISIQKLTEDSEWEETLVKKYDKDLSNKKYVNLSPVYQYAVIKTDSPFYWFQKGAKWHLNYMVTEMEKINELANIVKEIKNDGWSYKNSVAKDKDKNIYDDIKS